MPGPTNDAASSSTSTPDLSAQPLPPPGPGLFLVAADTEGLMIRLDRACLEAADSLDIRTDVLWVEVADGPAFVRTLVQQFPDEHEQRQIRLGWTAMGATVDQLMQRALQASGLDTVAAALEAAAEREHPPVYEVRYQPVIRLDDRTVIGFESLIRAQQLGTAIDAEELIARADRGGWLREFDQLARSLAVQGVDDWLGQGLLFLNVLAPDGHFDIAAIRATVDEAVSAGLEPDQLVLEAVERNRYESVASAADQVAELRTLGVRIAIDDVGEGFASLSLVTRFRPDVVKISGTIVADLPSSEAVAVIEAIVALAHDAGAWVVAENIETDAQADQLAAVGVDWGQGNFLGVPTTTH